MEDGSELRGIIGRRGELREAFELRLTDTVRQLAVSRGAEDSAMERSLPELNPLDPTARSSLSICVGPSLRSLTIAAETPKFFASA